MLRLTQGVCVSVCVSVCLYVCLSVYLCYLHSPNGWGDFDEIFQKWCNRYLQGLPISNLKFRSRWRHGGHFDFFKLSTLTDAIMLRLFSKLQKRVENSDPVFSTKNQQNRLKTLVNMAKINFWWPFWKKSKHKCDRESAWFEKCKKKKNKMGAMTS